MSAVPVSRVVSMMLIIVGNMLGAGILALPVTLSAAGFGPSILGAALSCCFMFWTAVIYSRQKTLVENENADLPTFFEAELGPVGKWLTVIANLIILYGLLVAYMSGVTTTVTSLVGTDIPPMLVTVLFFAVGVGVISFGMSILERCNALFIIVMAISFAMLVFLAMPQVEIPRLDRHMWVYLPAGLPVLVTAFHFHNIIPTICRGLQYDRKAITTAVLGGCISGLVINVIWIVVVLGAVPFDSGNGLDLISAFHKNLPATIPLSKIINSPLFTQAGLVFALFAMTTSFMANGTALYSFVQDLASNTFNIQSKKVAWGIAFLPTLFVSLVYPDIFIKAMDIVGGIGINIIFGLLPAVLVWKYAGENKTARYASVLLFLFFGFILGFEIMQEMGLTHISPDTEYWKFYSS
ncbi:MAG: aromatic amino acid transport family protein [Desulfovibrio sp.]